ncbi:hypothetical protein [Streptomyces tremellae]|uniref:Uncharacterized protein n=1 Tax=Streptomyces tremellae TaxID=1124239 RepID=A0ABP7FF72_9ACTN
MKKHRVDPRDMTWEQEIPYYRAYFWDRGAVTSHEYELSDVGIDEALAWTRQYAQEKGWTYTFYVRVHDRNEPGLVRIEGVMGDPFDDV